VCLWGHAPPCKYGTVLWPAELVSEVRHLGSLHGDKVLNPPMLPSVPGNMATQTCDTCARLRHAKGKPEVIARTLG